MTTVPAGGPTAVARLKESAAAPPKSVSKPEILQKDESEDVGEKSKLVNSVSVLFLPILHLLSHVLRCPFKLMAHFMKPLRSLLCQAT